MKTKHYFTFLIALLFLAIASCNKDKKDEVVQETDIVTDADGNIYKTIKIGNQWWMAENLKSTKYSNGALIQSVTDETEWSNLSKGAYCNFDNKPDNAVTYGHLYNWYAINDSNKLAPTGWHIPSDEDWKILERELGMSEAQSNEFGWRGGNEGDKLKIEAPKGWTEVSPVWGTNTSGFTALAGACRLFNGGIAEPGLFACAFWWTSSSSSNKEAYYRHLDKKNSAIFRSYTYKNYGFSVRCVKD